MSICRTLLAVLVLLSGALSTQAATTFYVSPTGNDSWDGLADTHQCGRHGPLRTLQAAQTAMEGQPPTGIKTTTVRGGTYTQTGAFLSLTTPADDGEKWIPYLHETPIIDGGGSAYLQIRGANITWEGFTFHNMGSDPGDGFSFHIRGGPLTIRWNTLTNCPNNCLGGPAVINSTIDSNTLVGVGANGIRMWFGSSGNSITHNLVQNVANTGLDLESGPSDPSASNNHFDRNILRNTCTTIVDCGAVYLFDEAHNGTGNQVTNNLVDGDGNYTINSTVFANNLSKAIYLDAAVSNVLVSGNICRGCGDYGFQIHAGDHNTITNNIWDLSSGGSLLGFYQTFSIDFGMAGNTFTNNIVYSKSNFPSSLWDVGIGGGDALPTDNTNLYFSATGASIPNTGVVDTNPKNADPQFTNETTGNYTMPGTSPAFTQIGWVALPTDQGPLANPFL